MKFCTSMDHSMFRHNTRAWVFAEHSSGKRVTKDMITFDTNREDVKVNCHGVVLFYDRITAQCLLSIDFKEVKHPWKD